ncbi:stalk domain-containing protein [Peptoclostridium litorale]|uniref:stalk domain-containing protein n=1 Tax=Peptoclostridium litorale TaxID=1557 RepID=UPI000940C93E
MVPIRFICEELGADVKWIDSTSEVECMPEEYKIEMWGWCNGHLVLHSDIFSNGTCCSPY